ncbi:aldehyde dehydrogenase family protein [Flavobacteriaceae bacterium]|nr:aldehyde dehydrogenase family protein [Flavobacteriaceae bacterium]
MKKIKNFIHGVFTDADDYIHRISPSTEKVLSSFPRSSKRHVDLAVKSSIKAFDSWSNLSPVKRGKILLNFVIILKKNKIKLAEIVAKETGKIFSHALGEVEGSIQLAHFFSSESMRLYGKTIVSGNDNKNAYTLKVPVGITALIVPANTPIANIAWKVFPSLVCGNCAILKSSEDAPETAEYFLKLSHDAGVPNGVLNLIHGYGHEAGSFLVNHDDVKLISFTGSSQTGRIINQDCAKNFKKVSLELGGKNPFIVCDDSDIDNAVKWAISSCFSNAGQRCAAASRLLVQKSIYSIFLKKFKSEMSKLKLGINEDCYLGPVMNKKQYDSINNYIDQAKNEGASVYCSGTNNNEKGYYIKPTVIENLNSNSELNDIEFFGPVVIVNEFDNDSKAITMSNNSKYGLTSCVHTQNINRAILYTKKMNFGLCNINSATYGSEPHMPFGGVKNSGNGSREPGTEAIDFYTELKMVSFTTT